MRLSVTDTLANYNTALNATVRLVNILMDDIYTILTIILRSIFCQKVKSKRPHFFCHRQPYQNNNIRNIVSTIPEAFTKKNFLQGQLLVQNCKSVHLSVSPWHSSLIYADKEPTLKMELHKGPHLGRLHPYLTRAEVAGGDKRPSLLQSCIKNCHRKSVIGSRYYEQF